jgi:hypothetical protein
VALDERGLATSLIVWEIRLRKIDKCSSIDGHVQHRDRMGLCLPVCKEGSGADGPEKCSKLGDIHNNPSYLSRHLLNRMEGSLGKQGDSHAKQNHSFIIVCLGNGVTLNLAEHVFHLLEWHKSKVRQRRQAEDRLTIIL